MHQHKTVRGLEVGTWDMGVGRQVLCRVVCRAGVPEAVLTVLELCSAWFSGYL